MRNKVQTKTRYKCEREDLTEPRISIEGVIRDVWAHQLPIMNAVDEIMGYFNKNNYDEDIEMFGTYNHKHYVIGMIVFTLIIISVIIYLL